MHTNGKAKEKRSRIRFSKQIQ